MINEMSNSASVAAEINHLVAFVAANEEFIAYATKEFILKSGTPLKTLIDGLKAFYTDDEYGRTIDFDYWECGEKSIDNERLIGLINQIPTLIKSQSAA
jgi:hypothetical protein